MSKRSMLLSLAILLLALPWGVANAGGTWYVAPDGQNTNTSQSAAAPCLTIQAAVGKAASGDTINIAAGIYHENVDIVAKNLTLIGASPGTTIIDGGGISITSNVNASRLTVRNGGGVFIETTGIVQLSDLIISNNSRGIFNFGSLTVTGTTIDGNDGAVNVGGGLWNRPGAQATLTNVTISHNKARFDGGGVMNSGTLIMSNAIVSSNVVSETTSPGAEGEGGGIYNDGTLTMTNAFVSNNSAAYGGGGIANTGRATLNSVTISANTATIGAGIDNYQFDATSVLTLTNVTITGNTGSDIGGGMTSINSDVTLTNVTMSNNTADQASALYVAGTTRLHNTIITSSTPVTNCTLSVPIISLGHNLENGSACGLSGPGDLASANPLLGPLQQNGGFAPTQALLSGSPAIDAGANAGCPATDQRGRVRPFDGDKNGSAICDIGSYELNPLAKAFYVPLVMK
jgi:hypothetical protein